MKIISFSLWGNNPKYTVGAIKNAELAKIIYPDWICRFYVDKTVPNQIIWLLESMDNTQIIIKNKVGDWTGMFWRFEPASEEDIEVMISRDTDSRLNLREHEAVNEWLLSDKKFHIMRDHPYHKFPVLGGMWGVKKNGLSNMKQMIESFSQKNEYGTDYNFFSQIVLPNLSKDNIMVHDEFFDKKLFPTKREGYQFVGQVFDENDNTPKEHIDVLKNSIEVTHED